MSSEERLLQAFDKLKKTMFDRDARALREAIAEDYRGFDPQGQPQDRNMILEAYRPGGVQLGAYDVEELETRILGPVGLITGKGRIHGKYGEHGFEHVVRFVDVYVERGGCWQLYYSQVTPLTTA